MVFPRQSAGRGRRTGLLSYGFSRRADIARMAPCGIQARLRHFFHDSIALASAGAPILLHSTLDSFPTDMINVASQVPLLIAPPMVPRLVSPASVPGTRVLHLINGEYYAGAERVQDLLAKELVDLGYEVGFACLKPGVFAAQRRSRHAPLYELAMRHRLDFAPIYAIARLVKSQRYQLIHTHTPRTALFGRAAAALAGVPLVHHLHSPTTTDSTHPLRDCAKSMIERWGVGRAEMVIAVSNSLADYGRSHGIRADRLRVIPNGVPVGKPLARVATPAGRWTIGCVALFRPRKGIEVLLDALAMLREEGHDVALRAVGTFESEAYRQSLLAYAARLGLNPYVTWVGFSSDVPAELARLDLFALPSLFGEGMPMVVIEAMAAGVPVVASRVEGVPEVIRHDVDGLLTLPGDSADLAAQIKRVLHGEVDWQGLRLAAYRRQAEHFSARSMASATAAAYRQLGVH
jgi:glycosyltransferase involved in cell wall biosynthesis